MLTYLILLVQRSIVKEPVVLQGVTETGDIRAEPSDDAPGHALNPRNHGTTGPCSPGGVLLTTRVCMKQYSLVHNAAARV